MRILTFILCIFLSVPLFSQEGSRIEKMTSRNWESAWDFRPTASTDVVDPVIYMILAESGSSFFACGALSNPITIDDVSSSLWDTDYELEVQETLEGLSAQYERDGTIRSRMEQETLSSQYRHMTKQISLREKMSKSVFASAWYFYYHR